MATLIYFRRAEIGMARDSGSTRRRFLRSGALVGGALLAGCTGGDSDGGGGGDTTTGGGTTATTESTTTSGDTTQETTQGTESTEETTEGSGGGSYSVTMAPVGEVTFDAVPERVVQYFPGYADMSVAFGAGDTIASVGVKSRYYTSYYEQLDGVSVDKGSITELYADGIDKELFYEIDSDLHMVDPPWLINNSAFGLTQQDIEAIREQVAPFLGNTIFRRTDEWHTYRYYTMYEAFEKVAQVFRQEERYRAFKRFHDEFISGIQGRLPAESGRPRGLLVFASGDEPEEFSPYRLTDRGTNKKQFRDLGIRDALAGTGIEGLSTSDRGTIDYEVMLEVDPESLLVRGYETMTESEFQNTVVRFMKEHPVASQLTAVNEGQVFRGGPIYEGPIQNLFLTERFAKAYFPDTFTEDQLFNRGRVASIVTGN